MGQVYSAIGREYNPDTMFHFYTKVGNDGTGNTVIIPILAMDEDHAWDIFDGFYSRKYLVDQIINMGKV